MMKVIKKVNELGEIELIIMEGDKLLRYLTNGNSKKLSLPKGINKIGSSIFAHDEKIDELIEQHIEDEDERECFIEILDQLQFDEVYIPKSVKEIEEGAFAFAEIGKFTLEDDGSFFTVIDGMLCNKDETVLIACSGTENEIITIPSKIKRIGNNAFSSIPVMIYDIELIIPEGVEEIGEDAFHIAFPIICIKLSKSINKIEARGLSYGDNEFPEIYAYENTYAHEYLLSNDIEYELIK